jgi:hypothetical protein
MPLVLQQLIQGFDRGREAVDLVGFAPAHEQAFQQVADEWDCVIMSRETGWVCQQLIAEGYGSKGFHVKSKSCTWGPMAGFLLEDVRLTKSNDLDFQYKEIQARIQYRNENWRTPLFISNERVAFLKSRQTYLKISEWQENNSNTQISVRAFRSVPEKLPNLGDNQLEPDEKALQYINVINNTRKVEKDKKLYLELHFMLVKDVSQDIWGVYFANGENACQEVISVNPLGLIPVMALTDPLNPIPGYKGAITGDYDLFAVFARNSPLPGKIGYEKDQLDLRVASVGEDSRFDEGHPDYGHVSQRILILINELNKAIYKQDVREAYKKIYGDQLPNPAEEEVQTLIHNVWLSDEIIKGSQDNLEHLKIPSTIRAALPAIRKMVHHNDEGGRPQAPNIEPPLIGFIPGERMAVGIRDIEQLKIFLTVISKNGFKLPINPSWRTTLQDLGDKIFVPDRSADVFRRTHTGKSTPVGKDRKAFGLSSFPTAYSVSSSHMGEQPVQPVILLNGMKVIFDQPVSVYPVTLESKAEAQRNGN